MFMVQLVLCIHDNWHNFLKQNQRSRLLEIECSTLEGGGFVKKIKNIINDASGAYKHIESNKIKWELIKLKIKETCIIYANLKSHDRRNRQKII